MGYDDGEVPVTAACPGELLQLPPHQASPEKRHTVSADSDERNGEIRVVAGIETILLRKMSLEVSRPATTGQISAAEGLGGGWRQEIPANGGAGEIRSRL